MSNAVDVLLVGGPKDGMMVCVKRPVPSSYTHYSDQGDVTYPLTVFNFGGLNFRVGRYDESVTDAQVAEALFNATPRGFGPAWDLMPAATSKG